MSRPSFPAMTPNELIALLDAMCSVALCERRRKSGQTVYQLTVDDIYEADDILNRSFDPES